jgi:hypothetical protein
MHEHLQKRSNLVRPFPGSLGAAVLFFGVFMVGCGGSSGPSQSPEAAHIGKVGQLITDFKAANRGTNPKNLNELKTWAVKNGKAEDVDFVSTRDNEPYVLEPQAMSRGGMASTSTLAMAPKTPVILHEATGKNGKKFVVQGLAMEGSEMSDEGLKYLTHGPIGKKAK